MHAGSEIHSDIEKHVLSVGLVVDSVQISDMNANNLFSIDIACLGLNSTVGENGGQHIPQICYLASYY